MPSHQVQLIRTIVGVIGNIISFGLFLSPVPTFIKIYKKKSVEEFQAYPYLSTVVQCMIWVFYGLPYVTENNTLVCTINGIGIAIELIYLAIFFYHDKHGKSRKKIAWGLLIEIAFVACVILFSMLCTHKLSTRALIVGVIADAFNIIMYGSPLAIVKKVVETKSVKYMPFLLSFTVFINSILWTAYALIIFDLFVLISNSCGVLLGLIQLIIYASYFRQTPKEEEPEKKPAELQLSQQPSEIV